ncbi:MAG: hypothetical protein ACE5GV_12450 [Candidatus Scalindua sp.]
MGKKKPWTPQSRIKSSLRRLWLYSRERTAAKKRDKNKCVRCGSADKVEVHHKNGIEWKNIIDYIYEHLLVNPELLECLCGNCHKEKHAHKEKDKRAGK